MSRKERRPVHIDLPRHALPDQDAPNDLASDMQPLIDVDAEPLLALAEIDEPVNDCFQKPKGERPRDPENEPTMDDGMGGQPVVPGNGSLQRRRAVPTLLGGHRPRLEWEIGDGMTDQEREEHERVPGQEIERGLEVVIA